MQGVYFVADRKSYAIKIGYSDNIDSRLRTFWTSNPNELELVAVWHNASMSDEAKLHKMFKSIQVKGEWFILADVLAFIEWFNGYNADFSVFDESIITIYSKLANPIEYREKVFTWFSDHDKQVQSMKDWALRFMMLRDGIAITAEGFKELKKNICFAFTGIIRNDPPSLESRLVCRPGF